MTYVSKHARFTVLDGIPADGWQESTTEDVTNEHVPIITDPDKYLCIVGEEAYDYDGSFTACVYSSALYRRDHVGVSYEYLRDSCTLAPEETARKIIAHYLRVWADMEDPDTADILVEEAERVANMEHTETSTVYQLTPDQLQELAESYLCDHYHEYNPEAKELEGPSYGELVEALDIVGRETLENEYSDTTFTADDFFCTASHHDS